MELTIHIEGEQITLGGESLAEKLQALDDQLHEAEARCDALRRERKLIGKLDRLLSATKRAQGRKRAEGRGHRAQIAGTNGHAPGGSRRRGRGEMQAAALEYLRANGRGQVRDVGTAIGLDPARASQTLVGLMAAGKVRQVKRGVYELDPAAEHEGSEEPP